MLEALAEDLAGGGIVGQIDCELLEFGCGGGDEFAAGDGIVFMDEGEDFPRDIGKVGAVVERIVPENHGSNEDAENDAMRDGHRRDPAHHRRPVAEREQDDDQQIGLSRDPERHRERNQPEDQRDTEADDGNSNRRMKAGRHARRGEHALYS